MDRMIFVNLPVTDVSHSKRFYEALGFNNNPHFSDESTACMALSESIIVMLHTRAKWISLTSRPVPPSGASEVILAISCDSREAVDRMNEVAAKQGGSADINPKQDLGFMYSRSLADPDGHAWQAMWMDPAMMSTSG